MDGGLDEVAGGRDEVDRDGVDRGEVDRGKVSLDENVTMEVANGT